MANTALIAAYSLPFVSILSAYLAVRRRKETRSLATQSEAVEAGLNEPASLHPRIDPARCLGCGTCTRACPEGNIIGLIGGKAVLVEPSSCIGHGACKAACPHGAIALVFGTATRGVELPNVGPDFQTNVPGLYIAGELGGMGLIRNAIEQGRQAVASISRRNPASGRGAALDLVIVGAGPAGLSAGLAAKQAGLSHVILEQDQLGGTIAHFPRGKLVMTRPADLPIIGKFQFREVSKETLMHFWRDVVARTALDIRCGEKVSGLAPLAGGGFAVSSTSGQFTARAVLLAIGRRGTPRRLGVPGEEQAKVIYSLVDAQDFAGRHMLVVGGGDSALEAAASLAEQDGTTVTLSYRSAAFARAKAKNRRRVDDAVRAGRLTLLLQSEVTEIGTRHVTLTHQGHTVRLPNDGVIVCAGGILPTAFLKQIGILTETKYGTA